MSARREPVYHSLSLSIPTTLILTTIIFRIVYAKYMKKTTLIKSLMFMSILSILFFLSFSVIHLTISIMEISNTFSSSYCIIYYLKDLLMVLGKAFMYTFFIGRLYFVFHGSVFHLHYKHTLYLAIFVFISLLIPSLMIISAVVLPINAIIHNKSNQYEYIDHRYDCSDIFYQYLTPFTKTMMSVAIAMFAILDIIVSIIILRLYLNRLLLLSIAYEQIKQKRGSNQHEKSTNMKRNTLFLETAMKIFNLMALAISTSWLGVVFQGTGYGSHWLCIDITVNALTMFLSFSFSKNIYNKLSIFCCTNWCFNGWRKLCICCCVTKKLPVHVEVMINKQKEHKDQHNIQMSTGSNTSTTDTDTPALTQQTYGSDC